LNGCTKKIYYNNPIRTANEQGLTGTQGTTGLQGATGIKGDTGPLSAAGDKIHAYLTYTGGNGNTAHDLTLQVDMF
jgi:hypothetical protein